MLRGWDTIAYWTQGFCEWLQRAATNFLWIDRLPLESRSISGGAAFTENLGNECHGYAGLLIRAKH